MVHGIDGTDDGKHAGNAAGKPPRSPAICRMPFSAGGVEPPWPCMPGKIWIDGTTFREVKQYLSQRGVKSNVLVNVETQNFELVRDDKGNQFNLLRSISAQQLLNAAGRDFVLQRTVQFSDYVINTPHFSGALAAEHSSDDPM